MQRVLVFVGVVWLVLPAVSNAAEDPAEAACHQKDTTVDIMTCLEGVTAQWDRRLNAAYQAALKASESSARRAALVQAERAWLGFRKDNCGWYGAQEGTIREVAGTQCMLDMTRGRAMELEEAVRP